MSKFVEKARVGALVFGVTTALMTTSAMADVVHLDDVIVTGSLCAGFDCVNGETFGFDTIRVKENNLRVHFDDTSASASFPANDWRILINDSANGGANYFAVEDSTASKVPFKVEAGAPNNTLYVESDGDVGIGTANPVVRMHIVKGDSPGLRLEQDGSAGFTPQVWDLAGNETNFFVRDVSHGSALPFKIKPGAATDALVIDSESDVGIGAGVNPTASLHVKRGNGTAKILVEETSATVAARRMGHFKNNGDAYISLENTSAGAATPIWNVASLGGELRLVNAVNPGVEFALSNTGNLTIQGTLTTSGSCSVGCDRVFDRDYEMPSINQHAKDMWRNKHLPAVGPTAENGPMNLSDKIGGMLNELEKAHIFIDQLNKRIERLEVEKG